MNPLFNEIRALAQSGLGVDDICVKLKISDRDAVRKIVFSGYPAEVVPVDGIVRIKA